MKIFKINTNNLIADAIKLLKDKKHFISYHILDFDYVIAPKSLKEKNELFKNSKKLLYNVKYFPYPGGVIVGQKGDFQIIYVNSIANKFKTQFLRYFITFLKNKNINAFLNKNDIIVDDKYKICGTSEVVLSKDIKITLIHIGINTNLKNIKQICTKSMVKIPKGLSEYGITTEEIEQMFLDFCKSF